MEAKYGMVNISGANTVCTTYNGERCGPFYFEFETLIQYFELPKC